MRDLAHMLSLSMRLLCLLCHFYEGLCFCLCPCVLHADVCVCVCVCVSFTQLSAVSRHTDGVSGGENPLCKVGHGVRSLVSG